ncbi:hypothetical protein DB30_02737 [Enhygromyxa salina]|uniref:Uncharacterized protein n=1 Tax=Enhygromyxa salina TaxID=215803 RepID=A0A0C2D8N3_9BACT|nr:hypothetical protein DB30_02737 [Enhygromyxa salina]
MRSSWSTAPAAQGERPMPVNDATVTQPAFGPDGLIYVATAFDTRADPGHPR